MEKERVEHGEVSHFYIEVNMLQMKKDLTTQ